MNIGLAKIMRTYPPCLCQHLVDCIRELTVLAFPVKTSHNRTCYILAPILPGSLSVKVKELIVLGILGVPWSAVWSGGPHALRPGLRRHQGGVIRGHQSRSCPWGRRGLQCGGPSAPDSEAGRGFPAAQPAPGRARPAGYRYHTAPRCATRHAPAGLHSDAMREWSFSTRAGRGASRRLPSPAVHHERCVLISGTGGEDVGQPWRGRAASACRAVAVRLQVSAYRLPPLGVRSAHWERLLRQEAQMCRAL